MKTRLAAVLLLILGIAAIMFSAGYSTPEMVDGPVTGPFLLLVGVVGFVAAMLGGIAVQAD
jgi:hypothetical protein